MSMWRSAEIFMGCGGLALGMARAGYHHALMSECDIDANATVRHNVLRGVEHVVNWPVGEPDDVREIDWKPWAGKLAVISGGPPCQPFGIGGKKRGSEDSRDMWPEAIRAVRETTPTGFLFENVRNLAGPRFREYLEWIVLHLQHPRVTQERAEQPVEHLERLRRLRREPEYRVTWQVVNAADFGAPQVRHRVLIFGLASWLDVDPEPMKPTHARDRLLWDQYVTGVYWKRHGLQVRTPRDDRTLSRVRALARGDQPSGLPWLTVRDAIAGLGEPNGRFGHVLQPGARVYHGHTGSPLDMPAKALKAGDHGVPGGENMMVLDTGDVRYFTMREAARLVGLPDTYTFPRSWTESMRQLGNAVPCQLGEAAGCWLREMILRNKPKVSAETLRSSG